MTLNRQKEALCQLVSTVTDSCDRCVLLMTAVMISVTHRKFSWFSVKLPSTAIRSLSSCCSRLWRSSNSNSRALKHSRDRPDSPWQAWARWMNHVHVILTKSWVQIHIEPESSSAGPTGTTAASEPDSPVCPVLRDTDAFSRTKEHTINYREKRFLLCPAASDSWC